MCRYYYCVRIYTIQVDWLLGRSSIIVCHLLFLYMTWSQPSSPSPSSGNGQNWLIGYCCYSPLFTNHCCVMISHSVVSAAADASDTPYYYFYPCNRYPRCLWHYCTLSNTPHLAPIYFLVMMMIMMIQLFVGLVVSASPHAIISTATTAGESNNNTSSLSSSFCHYNKLCCPCTLVYYQPSTTTTAAAAAAVFIVDQKYIIFGILVVS